MFIAGTDTGVGKTLVTGLLARHFLDHGESVITQKWIQSGSEGFPEDVDTHLELMGKTRDDYEPYMKAVCPYHFPLPASAHLAAEDVGVTIDPNRIVAAHGALKKSFDRVLVEGLGGVLVPYNRKDTVLDIVEMLKLPVVLVVGNKLGCLNHTLLTLEVLKARRIEVLGLIFSEPEPVDPRIGDDNVAFLSQHAKVLGEVKFGQGLNLTPLTPSPFE